MRVEMRMIAALSALLLAAACGDAEVPEAGEPVTTDTAAQPGATGGEAALPPDEGDVRTVNATLAEWSVTLSQDSVQAGAIAFNVRNTGTMVHRFEVEGNGEEWETEDLAAGGDVTMSLNLTPGEYEVYCPIEGGGTSHRARGMTTTLRVY